MISFCSSARPWFRQRGQTFLVIVVFIAVFLLAVLGLATDYSQVWAHRQMAQGAADAACQAAAADLFLNAISPSASGQNGLQNFSWIGSPFNCSTNAVSPPCAYAALNGYSGSNVSVTFPSSLTGVNTIPAGFGTIAHPYIKVVITDHVPMSFTKLVSSTGTVNITASAGCGLNPVAVPIPLVVLHPTSTGALSVASAASSIKILGGPNRSIQVDSSSSNAVNATHSNNVNLSQAGPGGSGADFGAFGGPSTKPAGVNVGSSGNWVQPSTPISDPWTIIATPPVPGAAGTATPVPFAVNGCPDPSGCVEFSGGNYTACSNSVAPGGNGCLISPNFTSGGVLWQLSHPYTVGALIKPTAAQNNAGGYIYQALNTGISSGAVPNPWNQTIGANQIDGGVTWKNMGPNSTSPKTAIFDPGLYYIGSGGLNPGPNTTMRMSTGGSCPPNCASGDGSNGAIFYFSTAVGTVLVGNNTGKGSPCTSQPVPGSSGCIVSYKPGGSTLFGVTSRELQCPGGAANPPQVPAAMDGNILLAPCSGTYGSSDAKNRGFLFFQNRATAANPNWGGGGQFLLSGFMYFHQTGSYGSVLSMQGGSGAGAFTLGNIVVDKLAITGNSGITMILNPQVTFQVLKPQLLQ